MDFSVQLDTLWVLVGAALVFFMQAGFAMLEAGFTRAKNAGNIVMKNIMDFACGSLIFLLIGYGVLYGRNYDTGNIPKWAHLIFNTMFCGTSATIVSGAMAERTKFKAYLIYSVVISALIYPVSASWVWGRGWLSTLHIGSAVGFVDFSGSALVHMVGGISALLGAAFLGPRIGKYGKDGKPRGIPGHNITLGALGIFILWFGWFGFNAGSALKADGLAAHAFMTSAISAGVAMLSWMLLDVLMDKKPTLVGASTGLVVGLVAITPGAGFVPIWSAFIIGALVSPICFFGVKLIKQKLKIDDALDAFGCHGIGGIWGGVATGLFGKSSINSAARWDGLVFGDVHLFLAQLAGIGITIVIAVAGTLVCVGIVRIFTKIRVDDRAETIGLDLSEHGEKAYPSFNGWD